jgi:MFS-type transporter involved in bile tolerance (Atg22 family)
MGALIQRYVSVRYGWTLADATLLFSIQAGGSAIVLFTFLPWISKQIERRFSPSTIQLNVIVTRWSLLVLVLAYLVIGLAPTAPIVITGLLMETLSTGLPSALRALTSALVPSDDKGRVFAVLTVIETISSMVASPLAAAFFNYGLEKGGGIWLGLPYDTIALISAVSALLMCLLRFDGRVRI